MCKGCGKNMVRYVCSACKFVTYIRRDKEVPKCRCGADL